MKAIRQYEFGGPDVLRYEWAGRRVVAHLGRAGGGYAEPAVAAVDARHERRTYGRTVLVP